jgi:hypothetical protein
MTATPPEKYLNLIINQGLVAQDISSFKRLSDLQEHLKVTHQNYFKDVDGSQIKFYVENSADPLNLLKDLLSLPEDFFLEDGCKAVTVEKLIRQSTAEVPLHHAAAAESMDLWSASSNTESHPPLQQNSPSQSQDFESCPPPKKFKGSLATTIPSTLPSQQEKDHQKKFLQDQKWRQKLTGKFV